MFRNLLFARQHEVHNSLCIHVRGAAVLLRAPGQLQCWLSRRHTLQQLRGAAAATTVAPPAAVVRCGPAAAAIHLPTAPASTQCCICAAVHKQNIFIDCVFPVTLCHAADRVVLSHAGFRSWLTSRPQYAQLCSSLGLPPLEADVAAGSSSSSSRSSRTQ